MTETATPTIDLTTGLPEVPEDMFWRVRERRGDRWEEYQHGYVVELMRKSRIKLYEQRKFLGIFTIKPIMTEEESDSLIASEWILITRFEPSDKYKKETQVAKARCAQLRELTPELILETAVKVLEKYEDLELRRKFLGDYPPKTLTKEN